MNKTNISWTDFTLNPITGCTAISEGCKNCYAKTVHERFNKDISFSEIHFHKDRLSAPYKRKKPAKIFIGSMTDIFHDDVKDSWLDLIMKVVIENPQHTFQILTKRDKRMKDYLNNFYTSSSAKGVIENLWIGVTVENNKEYKKRTKTLLETPASIRFISFEPLVSEIYPTYGEHVDKQLIEGCEVDYIGYSPFQGIKQLWDTEFEFKMPLKNIDIPKIDWVIVGGETGLKKNTRVMNPEWVENIYNNCKQCDISFFFKQWGNSKPKNNSKYVFENIQEFPTETFNENQKDNHVR